ncbi:hypothetical protein SCO02_08250 [Staphylococcus ureilyticus]|uniref:Uncharacterized protein n=1 Tax=Staphylococcus ureilyticus TaxID=94138 RepID=A0AB34AIN7_STAUR|nr:hypothetical protein [Staphylococcus ureilyticus]GEQ02384.1 hypothetical protein SCO02_08250 [Staphylococcus ureilyticus]
MLFKANSCSSGTFKAFSVCDCSEEDQLSTFALNCCCKFSKGVNALIGVIKTIQRNTITYNKNRLIFYTH